MTINDFRTKAAVTLSEGEFKSPTPLLDCDVLLQFILKQNKAFILAHREQQLSGEQEKFLLEAVEKRKTGLPVAYITGEKEFYGHKFFVSPKVLIPKPDTEILVEKASAALYEKILCHKDSILTVCDMCTGSGCVGISIFLSLIEEYGVPKEKFPKFTLCDISEDALVMARRNAAALIPAPFSDRINFVRSNLFEAVPYQFDMIASNPPYVPHNQAVALLSDGRREPLLALDGDVSETGDYSGTQDGLALIRRLIVQAAARLSSHGVLFMETGEYNAQSASECLILNGFKDVGIEKDLEGQLRVVFGIRKN